MNCELNIDGITEEEKLKLIPSYLCDFRNYDSYNTISHTENLVDKIRQLEAELIEMKEKLKKIERVMPWVSNDFEMDDDKSN